MPQVSLRLLDSGSSLCRVVQPREQVQILHHHSSFQSPRQQTLTMYEDIVLATEKLPPSHAPVLYTRPNAKESGPFLADSFKWTVLQKNGENKC